ncbi:hypothetical protein CDAR_483001 [Caerostris darwini]|uniref:Uncharacterized protein n=1 Tax=Caerostris darwini TaxID=1538125 RepID=A0AAV4MSH9_9ARAC|nr:hypothetical protein CDAR_483001 [Caerostris darwini]
MRESCLAVLRRLNISQAPMRTGPVEPMCCASRQGGLLLNGCRVCGDHEPSAIRVNCAINEDECGTDIFRPPWRVLPWRSINGGPSFHRGLPSSCIHLITITLSRG